jgi:hypothetical protein
MLRPVGGLSVSRISSDLRAEIRASEEYFRCYVTKNAGFGTE